MNSLSESGFRLGYYLEGFVIMFVFLVVVSGVRDGLDE